MARYEVFIPAKPGTSGESVTVEVEATSWLLALRSGMKQLGEQGDSLGSIMCENRPDGTVVVKDPGSRRMFRIKELEAKEGEAEPDPQATECLSARLRAEAEQAALEHEALMSSLRRKEQAEREAATRARMERENEERARLLDEQRKQEEEEQARERARQEEERRAAQEAARLALEREEAEKKLRDSARRASEAKRRAAEGAEGESRELRVTHTTLSAAEVRHELGESAETQDEPDINDILGDLFMETMDLPEMNAAEANDFVLDLALAKIEAEAGSVILTDSASPLADLTFAAARGAVSKQLASIRIPRGKGIVGFAVQYNLPLVVSDVGRNPNFYRLVAEKTGFATRSVLAVPITHGERVFGALELVNKKNSDRFTEGELSIAKFLAQKLGQQLNLVHETTSLD